MLHSAAQAGPEAVPPVDASCASSLDPVSHQAELADYASDWRRARPVRIVAIGSSSTAGAGASKPEFAYPARLAAYLGQDLEGWSVSVLNLGIGGETIGATVERLKAVLISRPTLIIWQVGTNDALGEGDEDAFRRTVEDGVIAARAAKVDLVVVDPQDFPGIKNRERYERYVDTIRAVADKYDTPLFSRYAMMKDWWRYDRERASAMLSKDGFHMSDRGYDCLARHMSTRIAGAVRNRSRKPPFRLDREHPIESAKAKR